MILNLYIPTSNHHTEEMYMQKANKDLDVLIRNSQRILYLPKRI